MCRLNACAHALVVQIVIDLNQVPKDRIVDGWYAVGQKPEDGMIKLRMLLTSQADELHDTTRNWLLADFDIVRLHEEGDMLQMTVNSCPLARFPGSPI